MEQKKIGRPKIFTLEEAAQRKRDRNNEYYRIKKENKHPNTEIKRGRKAKYTLEESEERGRKAALEYYHNNKEKILERRNIRNYCIICDKSVSKFKSHQNSAKHKLKELQMKQCIEVVE